MEIDQTISSKVFVENLILIANYVELGSRTLMKIAGNDISSKIYSEDLSDSAKGLIAANLSRKLSHHD